MKKVLETILTFALVALVATMVFSVTSMNFFRPVSADAPPATITLDATIRDFKAAHQPGGHIDFENGCCGNVLGIVQNTLGADGKPVYASFGTPFTTHGAAAFNQWYNDVSGVNQGTTKTLTLTKISDSPLLYQYNNPAYFPIDGELFGNYAFDHNYHFTSEIHTQFTYESGQTFSFVGDDDVWVFINNKLVIDLGGVHGPTGATVNLDSVAASIGITPGNQYNLDIFQAERQTSGSTFRITTSIILVAKPQDTQPPTIGVEDFTAECNVSGGGYNGSIPQATATDDVGVASLTNDAPSTFSHGQTTVTWTATDSSGNSATADQMISVVDTTAPAISAPADVTVAANTAGGFSGDTGTAAAADICDDSVQITNDAPGVFPVGDTTVTWTATDDSGNTATATQIVTVTAVPIIIDIKPGSDVNPVNVKEKGVIPVAILTTAHFDATTVDASSVLFGPGHASEAHAKGHIEDVDKDGDLDMVLHFEAQQAGISCGQKSAGLVGQTIAGVPIAGSDSLKTVGCK